MLSIDTKPAVTVGSKDAVNDFIFRQTGGIVQSGPFKGMQLLNEESWKDGNIGNKCLGCYEAELHEVINVEVKRLEELSNPSIINIGCAEGYYAIGLARLLPKATVWALDIDKTAISIALRAADLNSVKIYVGSDIVMAAPDLLVMDCEGNELWYLDVDKVAALGRTHIVVECHNTADQPMAQILADRFGKTHSVMWTVSEMSRNPNDFDFLLNLHSHTKWLAVSEGRPSSQYFLYMVPK